MQQALDALYHESRSLWVPHAAAEYHTETSALSFLRNHVSQSLPCVWRSAAASWKAVSLWNEDDFAYLRERVGQKRIEITHTPNGMADAVVQNSSLVTDVPELLEDIDQCLFQFASDAFAAQPSVRNIWMGDGRSVSTTHADPYENLYTVVTGAKIFQLRPPCDAAFLSKPALQNARWKAADSSNDAATKTEHVFKPVIEYDGWKLIKEEGETAWIDEDTIDQKRSNCLEIRLRAGDVLYIPALWYHRVSQEGITIAINLWYEMSFGRDWIYRELCSSLRMITENERAEKEDSLICSKRRAYLKTDS